MGLEEIISNIENDTKAKVNKVVDDAKAEASRIRDNAAKDAAEYTSEMRFRSQTEANQLVARETSKADIEAKQIYQNAVSTVLGGTISTIQDNLSGYVKSDAYVKLLNKLAARAIDELDGDCTITVQKADLPKLKGIDAKVVAAKDNFVGGLKAVSKDESMYVDYSLEAILEGMKDQLATNLMKLME